MALQQLALLTTVVIAFINRPRLQLLRMPR